MILGTLLLPLVVLGWQATTEPDYSQHLVQLSVTFQDWDQDRPWEKNKPGSRTGQAVVVDGNRLLVTSQMIANATWLGVEKHGTGREHDARIDHVDSEINLALLAVDQPGFFDDLTAVSFAEGHPLGRSAVSVRWDQRRIEAISSRIVGFEVADSRYSSLEHMFVELATDSDVGSWSEPVFLDGLLLGLTKSQANRQAKIIPADILREYLEMATGEGDYLGFASLGNAMTWNSNRHAPQSEFLGVDGEPRGVVIRSVPRGASGEIDFKTRDVLLELDGHPIDASGNYMHPVYGRMRFTNIAIDGHRPGEVIPALVLRNGLQVELKITLQRYPSAGCLIPWRREFVPPPYLIAGGLVFRELDGEYLRTWSDWKTDAPGPIAVTYQLEKHQQSSDRQRIIIMSSVIPHPYNIGYHGLQDMIVQEINGQPIDSIADVDQALQAPVNGFHRIVFVPNYLRAEIVLDATSLESATSEILASYHIGSAMRVPVEEPGAFR